MFRRRVSTLMGMTLLVGLVVLVTPSPASASHWQEYEDGWRSPHPYDAGGRDALVQIRDPNWQSNGDIGSAKFQAYDELIIMFDRLPDGQPVHVNIKYYTSKKTYNYSYQVQNGQRTIELGADDDLNEGNTISIQLCAWSGHGTCTEWATGRT